MRLVSKVEFGVDWPRKWLQAPGARQLERGLHAAYEAAALFVLVDVERQRYRRHHTVVGRAWKRPRLIDLLEPFVSGPDLTDIQREHEPPNIPSGAELFPVIQWP